MSQEYKMNLPKTEFPMRASLPQREPGMLELWDREKIYEQLMSRNEGKPMFLLHDGPPYANGDIHMGTALNKVLKDFIVRYKNMSGFKAPYIPGWDTHGLPIESQIIKKYKIDRANLPVAEFRDKCRDFAMDFVNRQRGQFMRLGGIGDWFKPYVTLNPAYEARQIEVFGDMFAKGYIYRGLKPVYWCPHDETALAEAEIEYQDSGCESIYVKFKVTNGRGKFSDAQNVSFVIWTTTTWTLPGNVAISVNPEFMYNAVKVGDEVLIMAAELTESVMNAAGVESYEIVSKLMGCELENIVCAHPFLDRDSLIICGGHVTLEAGTGCVHTAPGHGHEDFVAAKPYGLPVVVPVNSRGIMTDEAGQCCAGMYYEKANAAILEELIKREAILAKQQLQHSYPHCWRCKEPVIYRATEQWFASVSAIKETAVDAARGIKWVPGWGEDRMVSMIRERSDWCVSRQRNWGVPIPIFYCQDCGKELINSDTISHIAKIFEKEGSSAWYIRDASELMPEGTACSCGCGKFSKETDIMDVWFDSGSSHVSVLENDPELKWPADMYLEGGDQFRGWFQSSLLTSVAVKGAAPYKIALSHGWVVDGEGKKMSKSLGNYVVPEDVIKEYGADILRLWVASSDYRMDMRVSKEIFKQLGDIYLKIRNTARFILGNLDGFNPDCQVAIDELQPLDLWALSRLNALTRRVRQAYDDYEFHVISHLIHNFCVSEMSNVYLDIIKDRLYCEPRESAARRAAQTVMYNILDSLVKMLAPILAFTSDEIWRAMPHHSEANPDCVLYNQMPDAGDDWDLPEADAQRWQSIMALRDDVNHALEHARASKLIGKPLEAEITLFCDPAEFEFISKQDRLAEYFIVSKVVVSDSAAGAGKELRQCENIAGVQIAVARAPGVKCPRCWMHFEAQATAGQTALCPRCAEVEAAP